MERHSPAGSLLILVDEANWGLPSDAAGVIGEQRGIGKDHETDAEHYCEHCWLIGISTPLHRQLSGNSYRDLVSQASPESRD